MLRSTIVPVLLEAQHNCGFASWQGCTARARSYNRHSLGQLVMVMPKSVLRDRRMFSYVLDHDTGLAPNPTRGMCTLAKCKFGTTAKPNIVERAEKGDWVIGTGGACGFRRGESAGIGKLMYAMRVNRKIPLADYCRDYERSRIDAVHDGVVLPGRFALISKHFFYFGRNALDISKIPIQPPGHPLAKRGPGYRRDFDQKFIAEFTDWLGATFRPGIHGLPCKPRDDFPPRKCSPHLKSDARRGKRRC